MESQMKKLDGERYHDLFIMMYIAGVEALDNLKHRNYGTAEEVLISATERAEDAAVSEKPEYQRMLKELKRYALDKGVFQ